MQVSLIATPALLTTMRLATQLKSWSRSRTRKRPKKLKLPNLPPTLRLLSLMPQGPRIRRAIMVSNNVLSHQNIIISIYYLCQFSFCQSSNRGFCGFFLHILNHLDGVDFIFIVLQFCLQMSKGFAGLLSGIILGEKKNVLSDSKYLETWKIIKPAIVIFLFATYSFCRTNLRGGGGQNEDIRNAYLQLEQTILRSCPILLKTRKLAIFTLFLEQIRH